ncbi:tryptophan 7-halogenase [Saccharobesus litoralis]|uniref:Tryptophan 7-halogenase n=1 Tax=Saccharobesus litoralis TaxID=2172099 RepID=A0A2S0VUT1_9ALTE|nr:tryptophan halogenase family protein [Saccharobesus litoralis]AWB67969.1 tryptophan 7-halogenase [Saccharobesus litoralis]
MNKTTIAIIGGGTAGWMTAAILAKGLPQAQYNITLVESPDIPTVGVGEATIPPIIQLCKYLEVEEKALLEAVEGTYKYGIHFENWSQIGHSYMHAFGKTGTEFYHDDKPVSFEKMWLQHAAQLGLKSFTAFSPTATAAYNNKYSDAIPAPENANPKFYYPLSHLFHAYQFDAGLLANWLKEYAVPLGVNFISATVNDISQHSNGNIACVHLDNGEKISSDYFVDCSGAKGLLSKQTLNGEFIDWSAYLPCDSAWAVQTKPTTLPFPYTKSIAQSSGWRWQIPLRQRNGNGYVYSSQFIDDQQAKNELEQALKGQEQLTEPKQIKFNTGCLKQAWHKNVIALGLSAGFMEPLESTSIHLIHKYAIELKNAFIYGKNMQQEADMFNSKYLEDTHAILDFLTLHYHCTQRSDSAFWRHCSNMPIPESLADKLQQFTNTGWIDLPQGALFSYSSWLQVLMGQGYLSSYEQFKQNDISEHSARQFFTNVHAALNNEVAKLPAHSLALL